jgi:hypothetical protein
MGFWPEGNGYQTQSPPSQNPLTVSIKVGCRHHRLYLVHRLVLLEVFGCLCFVTHGYAFRRLDVGPAFAPWQLRSARTSGMIGRGHTLDDSFMGLCAGNCIACSSYGDFPAFWSLV